MKSMRTAWVRSAGRSAESHTKAGRRVDHSKRVRGHIRHAPGDVNRRSAHPPTRIGRPLAINLPGSSGKWSTITSLARRGRPRLLPPTVNCRTLRCMAKHQGQIATERNARSPSAEPRRHRVELQCPSRSSRAHPQACGYSSASSTNSWPLDTVWRSTCLPSRVQRSGSEW